METDRTGASSDARSARRVGVDEFFYGTDVAIGDLSRGTRP